MAKYRVTSEVKMINVDKEGCYIMLKDPGYSPKDGYFKLSLNHANYNSLYSLAVIAAVNRYKLQIRTYGDIVDTEYAEVLYMVISWD
ncbi:MAG: hypothetical protein GY845_21315 [Planctomycetes bacterium]|nr:hypothetical protein [Planctomycetota bacterium]